MIDIQITWQQALILVLAYALLQPIMEAVGRSAYRYIRSKVVK